MEKSMRKTFRLSFSEELINSISHGSMAILILLTIPSFSVFSYIKGGMDHAVGVGIFLVSLFLMFITSSLYHTMPYATNYKYVFRILDHSMIYIAIAGSYTPVALSLLGGWEGLVIIAIQWISVILGILYKAIAKNVNPIISLGFYLIMGWSVVFFLPKLLSVASTGFLVYIVLGGLLYSIGAIFYAMRKKYCHAIWHFFIIAASIAHMIAIIGYID